jgi:adenosine/AMP kinase
METEGVPVEIPADCNVIIGQSHFIKTAEDLYEAMVNSTPSAKFGIAFCEASGPRLVRVEGNDEELMRVAAKNAMRIGAGHTFVVLLKNAFPVNVLSAIKAVPEVCSIFCATANPLQVVVAKDADGRGVIGVIDGESPLGVENDANLKERREFLRKIGYKR